jgi:hypothetical protein
VEGEPALLTAETRRGVEIQDIPGRMMGTLHEDHFSKHFPTSIRLGLWRRKRLGGFPYLDQGEAGMHGRRGAVPYPENLGDSR